MKVWIVEIYDRDGMTLEVKVFANLKNAEAFTDNPGEEWDGCSFFVHEKEVL
jgi:hypothetical protein